MPFRDGSFTQVNSFGTLDLLPARAALAEYGRVLKPGGRLVMTVEGAGVWTRSWDNAASARRRINLMRGLAGNVLLGRGLDWQRNPITRRLSRHTQYAPATIARIVGRGGFAVERCEVLREYKGRPWIIGIAARKHDDRRAGVEGA